MIWNRRSTNSTTSAAVPMPTVSDMVNVLRFLGPDQQVEITYEGRDFVILHKSDYEVLVAVLEKNKQDAPAVVVE